MPIPGSYGDEQFDNTQIGGRAPVSRSRVVKSEQLGDTTDEPSEGDRVCGQCGRTWPFGTLECPDDGTLLIIEV